ncbi:DUF413 domain-containing protein [Shewanella sp. NIFS-20-20]|nr:DUF413 domain-containing protein [Shewanella sp. NIFS-20-20]
MPSQSSQQPQIIQYSQTPENISFASHKRFFDDIHFPKGFHRCGDFTQKEAEILVAFGHAMAELAQGKRLPCNEEEQNFVDVAQGNALPTSLYERIWSKYCKLAQGKPFYAVL